MRRGLVLCSLIAPYLVFGGSTLAAAGDPRAAQLTYGPWSKICLGSSNCFVGAGARGACYPSGGGLSIIVTDDKNASLSANLGTKRSLEGAISVQVDQGDPILILHPECHARGCGGKIEIDNAFIEHLKRSQTITIEATNTAHQKISLSLSLADFAKANDAAGTKPKVSEEIVTSDKMKELMKRGEKEKLPQCEE